MNILALLRSRLLAALPAEAADLASLLHPSQDAKFGDYQANCAMPLGKKMGRPPREVADELVSRLDVSDLCEAPEIAGPGFINLRLRTDWLQSRLQAALEGDRLGLAPVEKPRTYVVDFSAPNVAKPMHVGHIRSTVIGDSLAKILRFLGHHVITDNHIGDWGTQFGMIIYGFRNFLDQAAYAKSPVDELARLYRYVNRLIGYHDAVAQQPKAAAAVEEIERRLAGEAVDKIPAKVWSASKEDVKERKALERTLADRRETLAKFASAIAAVESDPVAKQHAATHPKIATAVLEETAGLHRGEPDNLKLWREFLPPCLADITRIYERLDVSFDHTLGESFYHDRLAGVVDELLAKGLARESEGAICVFIPGQAAPMIVRKQDGAFLYATTDLATIQYRMQTWKPDAILYVVDHRQSLHFEHLFAVAKMWGLENVEMQHVSFGTVLGDDGRPFKTRSGDSVGLASLLDEAIARATAVVCDTDSGKPTSGELTAEDQKQIAETVGIAALKYADLSQNRTSDYTFSYDKMLALTGNTATYMQYAYARVRSIFARGKIDIDALIASTTGEIALTHPAERMLGLSILRFAEALNDAVADYRPNHLTGYLFELANRYATFFEQCPVLKADSDAVRNSRLLLCELTARTLKRGLGLLGIRVVDKM